MKPDSDLADDIEQRRKRLRQNALEARQNLSPEHRQALTLGW
jgi:hypothetical protein